MRKTMRTVVAMACWVGGISSAQAAGGVHEHDGFYLNMDLGAGGLSSSASQSGNDAKFSGGAGEFGIAIGGAVAENFIVAGHLWGVAVVSPDYTLNGQKFSTTSDTTFALSAVGVNLTYYFMPYNFYVSATPSLGSLSAKQGGLTESTKNGFAIRLAVGKEWWVSDNWGLGLNLQYAHSSNDADVTNPPTWGTNWFGVAFSATYN